MKKTWDFVEKYYPDYYSSSEITENEDLNKIVNWEIEGRAETLFNEIKEETRKKFGFILDDGDLIAEINIEAQNRYFASLSEIYKKSIEGYLEASK